MVFFPSVSFSAYPGECIRGIYTKSAENHGFVDVWLYSELQFDPSSGKLTSAGYALYPIEGSFGMTARLYYFENGAWYLKSATQSVTYKQGTSPPSGFKPVADFQSATVAAALGNSCAEPCDTNDDDGDGICNTCDQLPGVPDKDDCLMGTTTNAAGETTSAVIDKNCNGQSSEWWTAENYTNNDKFIANIGDDQSNKGKLNCNENCTMEDPCSYGPSNLSAIVGSMSPSTAPKPPSMQEMIDSLLDLPAPEDLPDRCDGHNQQCKEYCEDKLGVGMSYCYEKDGKKKSNCVCNNNFAYDMVTDSDTPAMEQADINKDSNNSGVPDYADDSILNQGDADNDGITDKADVDYTGGQDSDGNGIDDAYTSNAQASANASAGLSQSDSRNLDSIATSTAQTSAATQGLKTGIDKISDNTADLIARADASIALSQDLRDKLNSFNDEETASLATHQGQLVDGLFPGIQPGDIPDDPTKDFDVDAFVQEFSFAFPDEVKTIIEGSSLQVQNPDSCVQGEIMGQQVQFCFDRFQAVFLAMGLLFKGLCVWRAIEIIAVGVRA